MTDFIMLKSDAPEEDVSNLLMEISYDLGMVQAAKDQAEKLKARIEAATKSMSRGRRSATPRLNSRSSSRRYA